MPNTDKSESTAISVQQPQQSQQPSQSPVVDGAAFAVIISCIVGLIKMASPVLLKTFTSKQEEFIQAQKESRKAELAIEAATATTMRSLVEQGSQASISMNEKYMNALTDRLNSTLDAVIASLGELSTQMVEVSKAQSQIASTQESIAETQMRTLELVARIETDLNLGGKPNVHQHRIDRRKPPSH